MRRRSSGDPSHAGSAVQPGADAAAAGQVGAGLAGLRGAVAVSRGASRAAGFSTQPRWRGEALEGRRVLLHAEQGLGDTIQFCRYATLVAARGGTAILEVQEPVERLMGSLAAVRAGLVKTARLGAETAGSSIWSAR